MKFKITRASSFNINEIQPCEEAHKEKFSYIYDDKNICKDGWFIEIETLEDLLKLKEKYGDLIIQDYYDGQILTIVIYDDYVE